MRKAKSLTLAMVFTTLASYAQVGGIEDSVNEVSDTIRAIFPIILGVIFLIGFLFNAGHFLGRTPTSKKGLQGYWFSCSSPVPLSASLPTSFQLSCNGPLWSFIKKIMKTFEVYRNIRNGALIWGLPISLFALLMVSVVASLLVIIFSFSPMIVLTLFIWNTGLFIGLSRMQSSTRPFNLRKVFPKSISNKKDNILNHVEDQHR